jgi:ribosomal-protein-alanine N-acetyltransferase
MRWFGQLFAPAPRISAARIQDAPALAALHAASFHRGWSDGEFTQFLSDSSVVADCAMCRRRLVGFVISRIAAGEAEILSVVVVAAERARGLGRRLLEWHLRRLAGQGCRTVFLEVDETNEPACRLYRRLGFREVGRRDSYYRTAGKATAALVMRRDIS